MLAYIVLINSCSIYFPWISKDLWGNGSFFLPHSLQIRPKEPKTGLIFLRLAFTSYIPEAARFWFFFSFIPHCFTDWWLKVHRGHNTKHRALCPGWKTENDSSAYSSYLQYQIIFKYTHYTKKPTFSVSIQISDISSISKHENLSLKSMNWFNLCCSVWNTQQSEDICITLLNCIWPDSHTLQYSSAAWE